MMNGTQRTRRGKGPVDLEDTVVLINSQSSIVSEEAKPKLSSKVKSFEMVADSNDDIKDIKLNSSFKPGGKYTY